LYPAFDSDADMLTNTAVAKPDPRSFSITVMVWLAVAAATAIVLIATPVVLYSASTLLAIGAGIVFLLTLFGAIAGNQPALRVSTLTWTYLLISQEILHPLSDPEAVRNTGNFDPASYSEPIVWIFALMVLAVLTTAKPDYLSVIFRGQYRWAVYLMLWSVLSVAYSPNVTYAFAWSIKLALVVLLLGFYLSEANALEQLERFFAGTFWGFAVLTAVPMIRALMDPDTLFQGAGGRLNANPSELSAVAGAWLLLGLILYALTNRSRFLVGALCGGVIMIAALGKAGIGAGLLAAIAFYLLRRKYAAVMAIAAAVLLVAVALFVTGNYFSRYVNSYKGGETLTGRTAIWAKAIPELVRPPQILIGHGYVASKFISSEIPGEMIVDHLHNGYLDVMFNDGLIGLGLMLALQVATGRGLWKAWRRSRFVLTRQGRQGCVLAAGSLALFMNLLLNGMFNATFGGRMKAPYMMLLGLVVVSEVLCSKSLETLCAQVHSATGPRGPGHVFPGVIGPSCENPARS
jgi:O-antigen ligase